MKICGIRVVLDPRCVPHAEARGVWPLQRIAVGPLWYALPPEERLAVLYHEAGHHRRRHREQRWLWLPLVLVWALGLWCGEVVKRACRKQEIEADQFAVQHGSRDELVAFLKRHARQEARFYPSTEERIRSLKEITCKP